MKKIKLLILIIFPILLLISCNDNKNNKKEEFYFLHNEITINLEEKYTLELINTTGIKEITFESSNCEVFTICDGEITPISPGVATASAKVEGFETKCKITINSDFMISATSKIMYIDDISTLTIKTELEGEIIWSCDNNDVVEIVPNGKTLVIYAISQGETNISAKLNNKELTCKIVVREIPGE